MGGPGVILGKTVTDQSCPYCESPTKLIDSAVIYGGRSFGYALACIRYPVCDAYVGCHPGTTRPLGRLANKELREAKSAAHLAFDRLWRRKMIRDRCSKRLARGAGYGWLSGQLGIDPIKCHIGDFDVTTCRRVVELCSKYSRTVTK